MHYFLAVGFMFLIFVQLVFRLSKCFLGHFEMFFFFGEERVIIGFGTSWENALNELDLLGYGYNTCSMDFIILDMNFE